MRSLLAALVAVLCLAAPAHAAAKTAPTYDMGTHADLTLLRRVPVRQAPSAKAKVLKWLKAGEHASYIDETGTWTRIRFEGGEAYIPTVEVMKR